MDKAARMLVETAEKSYMIAKSVGYSDPNYFSYVFKRQFGVSPSKYRTAYEKNEKYKEVVRAARVGGNRGDSTLGPWGEEH